MKYARLFLIVLAFAKAVSSNAQYIVDKVNAPLNFNIYPLSVQENNLKGDVFSFQDQLFDRKGNYILKGVVNDVIPAINETIEDAKKNGGVYYELDSKGRVVKAYSYGTDGELYDESTVTYENDLMTRYANKYGHHSYTYDNQGRLINIKTYDENGIFNRDTQYVYKKLNNGELEVTQSFNEEDQATITNKNRYKNGRLVYSGSKDFVNTYVDDSKGNWIKNQYDKSSSWNGGVTNRSIIYYSDFEDPQFGFRYEKSGIVNAGLFNLTVNGKTFTNEIGSFYGAADKRFKTYYVPEIQYYVVPKLSYQEQIKIEKDGQLDQVQTVIQSPVAYYRDHDNNRFVIIDQGKKLSDYSKITKQTHTKEGHRILYEGKSPKYVLLGFNDAKHLELNRGHYYNKWEIEGLEKVIDEEYKKMELRRVANKKRLDSLIDSKKASRQVTYSAGAPVNVKKVDTLDFQMFQNGKRIKNPAYFIATSGDRDLLFGYGLEDFLIVDYKNIAIKETVIAQRVAKENEVILKYDKGTIQYFYNNGAMITSKDYVITALDSNQYIVYLKKLGKTMFVDKNRPVNVRYDSSYTYVQNDWIIKSTGGIIVYSMGKSLPKGTFKYYVDHAGNAHIYQNDKPTWYLASYRDKAVGNYALEPHTGQTYVKK